MPRRRDESFIDDLFDLFMVAPLWVGPAMAAIVYLLLAWFMPMLVWATLSPTEFGRSFAVSISPVLRMFAPVFAGFTLLGWVLARIKRHVDRGRLAYASERESIDRLDWRGFERLVCSLFRQQGYRVDYTGRDGPDGGVDLRIEKSGQVTLVQCKHWKRGQVGIRCVRELLGVVVSEQADIGMLVTSGRFTPEAVRFASKNRITLIDGEDLGQMIAGTDATDHVKMLADDRALCQGDTTADQADAGAVTCPSCGAKMVQRTARQGPRTGLTFFGCTRFPECRGIRNIVG